MKVIYEPKGRAREYSPLALNVYLQCNHGCFYCYVPQSLHINSEEYHTRWPKPREGIFVYAWDDIEEMRKNKDDRQVLLSFAGDPYCSSEIEKQTTGLIISKLVGFEIPFAVLTKSHHVLRDIEEFKKAREFCKIGFSFTTINHFLAQEWEPNASPPDMRIAALKVLHLEGIRTFVSLEPAIEYPESIAATIAVLPWTDEFKLGMLNHVKYEKTSRYTATQYLHEQIHYLRANNKKIFVKEDLRNAAPEIELTDVEKDMDYWNVRRGKDNWEGN